MHFKENFVDPSQQTEQQCYGATSGSIFIAGNMRQKSSYPSMSSTCYKVKCAHTSEEAQILRASKISFRAEYNKQAEVETVLLITISAFLSLEAFCFLSINITSFSNTYVVRMRKQVSNVHQLIYN
uniref:Uncharacterized protein n=1 Tax=Glossina brevipalpis TaxID=37001 RepID=A0A1A9X403_9MUSC